MNQIRDQSRLLSHTPLASDPSNFHFYYVNPDMVEMHTHQQILQESRLFSVSEAEAKKKLEVMMVEENAKDHVKAA